ncbi:MAG: hypothetical protein HC795_15170 [Coleofasciculaceae cyanobacterium RL_1_1]|nr:hypothetical protein [Coleofasciculaceae cyanobacterium RL_1_1]
MRIDYRKLGLKPHEYRCVSDEAFRLGRLTVLRSFLDRNRLFHSDIGLIRFEVQARQNLATAIARLDPLNGFSSL